MDYLIEENGKIIRYFYHPQIGICNSCLKNGVWQEKKPVYVDSLDCFGLFAKNNNMEIKISKKEIFGEVEKRTSLEGLHPQVHPIVESWRRVQQVVRRVMWCICYPR